MNRPKTPLVIQKRTFQRRLEQIAARSGLRPPFGWRFFERSPLLKADHAAFLMQRGSHGAACVMTGAFGGEGFFSTLSADDEKAADGLIDKLIATQRLWRTQRLVGPVSPCLFDTDGGLTVSGFDEETSCFSTDAAPFWDKLLVHKGFLVTSQASLYRLDEKRFPAERYSRAAQESMRRFDYRVVSARAMGLGAACTAMAHMAQREPLLGMDGHAFYESLHAMRRAWSPETTAIAVKDGEAIGYLLTLADREKQILRAATVQVDSNWQRLGVTAALADMTVRAAKDLRMEAGVIDDGNFASRWCVENAGGQVVRQMRRYELKITHT